LNGDQVMEISCTEGIRRTASEWPGIKIKIERVSRSRQFGYVYRYDGSEVVNDEEAGSWLYQYMLILWTVDCKGWMVSMRLKFELKLPSGE
jgi:hypothetical protein